MSAPKARVTTFELCDRAYPGAPGFPRWTKPLSHTVGTRERIDAAITIEDLINDHIRYATPCRSASGSRSI